ncbi:MAG: N-acetylmuramoyl-L-alanine amidase [Candidatus Latescibacteria bacterium]|jgi:N-acetylmuramoyl-L-alanine amidase|nr:N-acetylmuramoyl-L-alanine amidase [Candidatus Latescibacterota bacterium]
MSQPLERRASGDFDITIGDDNWLTGIDRAPSPHHTGAYERLDSIVIHYTSGASAASSVKSLTDPARNVSAHLVVGRDLSVTQIVAFDRIAWHAGKSAHHGVDGLNKYSIGIEIDNAGKLERSGSGFSSWFGRRYSEDDVFSGVHRNQSQIAHWHRYTEEQIEIVYQICEDLLQRYPTIEYILGHEEISPKRKIDPGPAFPLDKIRDRLLNGDRDQDGAEAIDEPDITLEGGRTGKVSDTDRLNMRSAPEVTDNNKLGRLRKDTQVRILGEEGGWYHVKADVEGWVSKRYIDTDV